MARITRAVAPVLFALFALAVQMMLSFGHVHLDRLAAPSAPSAMTFGAGAVLLSERAPGHNPDGTLDAVCAICALIQLVATSVPGVAPALPLPARFGAIGLRASAERIAAPSRHSQSQARAPPPA